MLGGFFLKPKIKKTPLSLTINCQIFIFLGSTLHLLQEASWGCGASAGRQWMDSLLAFPDGPGLQWRIRRVEGTVELPGQF